MKPIARKPFPVPVSDHSLLSGVSNQTVLRTCFRVAEALNVESQAARTNQSVLVELYARVTSSFRENEAVGKQHFHFKDLFHDRPPHLEGTFELWQKSELWDLDSRVFLSPKAGGTICRVIAGMKRDAETLRWRLDTKRIWEVNWEDVEFVAGIHANNMRSTSAEPEE